MSFRKAIKHNKERREYYDHRAVDRTCRSHGSCRYCAEGRQHKNKKREMLANEQIRPSGD